jgi:ubiquinone/menaquinone biosynthesis C-methylase UbiE
MTVLKDVKERYSAWANSFEPTLCCKVWYDKKYLEIIPKEVIERDYGCGDPSKYVKEGEIVLDLGSGWGKICFIAAQIVWKSGKVIWVDMTDDMLALARKSKAEVVEKMGYDNIEFKHWYIQDLKTDLDEVDSLVKNSNIKSASDYKELNEKIENLKKKLPMIADNSIDVIVSNCVLNLVSDDLKSELFKEMFRVLKIWGRIAVSDIVSDEISPEHLKNDPNLWSGCLTWAFQEKEFLKQLDNAGFYWMTIDKYDEKPWHIVEWIEFRSVTVLAYKWKQWACKEKNQALIYKGPWKSVTDDDWHTFYRWDRMAICEKTTKIMSSEPYSNQVIIVEPILEITKDLDFDCSWKKVFRHPKETKSWVLRENTYSDIDNPCSWGSCC